MVTEKEVDKQKAILDLAFSKFWKKKVKEVAIFLLSLFFVWSIPLTLSQFIIAAGQKYNWGIVEPITQFQIWGFGFIICMLLTIIIMFIYAIYMLIKEWIKSNWEKSKEEAIEEVLG